MEHIIHLEEIKNKNNEKREERNPSIFELYLDLLGGDN